MFKNVLESVFSEAVVVKQGEVHLWNTIAFGLIADTFLSCPDHRKEIGYLKLAINFIFNNFCENNIIFWQKVMSNVILTQFISQFVFLLLEDRSDLFMLLSRLVDSQE